MNSELEREVKAALDKKRETALLEYQRGKKAHNHHFYEVAIAHFERAIEIIKIPLFYLALGNSFYDIDQKDQAHKNYKIALDLSKESGGKATGRSKWASYSVKVA